MKVFLDTNAVIFIHLGEKRYLSERALETFDKADELFISPMVLLELQFLEEVGRLRFSAPEIMEYLQAVHGAVIDDPGFAFAVRKALTLSWTRDPFDRVITAHADVFEAPLITRDADIRTHYKKAVW